MEVSHPRVSIHIERATVFIQDNDEVSLSFLSPTATVSEDVGQVEACVELQGSTEVAIEYSVATQSASAQGRYVHAVPVTNCLIASLDNVCSLTTMIFFVCDIF